jgi:hypothetical protein
MVLGVKRGMTLLWVNELIEIQDDAAELFERFLSEECFHG